MNVYEYKDDKDYKKNHKIQSNNSYTVGFSKNELKKSARQMGCFTKSVMSNQGVRLFHAITDFLFDKDAKGDYIRAKDYMESEPSIKGTLSFYLGMISTNAIARDHYQILHPVHLKHPGLNVIPSTGKRPDWFGVDSSGMAYLFESKGSHVSVSPSIVTSGKDQLQSIIEVNGYKKKQLERRVIAAGFKDGVLELSDIDPPDTDIPDEDIPEELNNRQGEKDKKEDEEPKIKLEFDMGQALYLYYRPIMLELLENESNRSIVRGNDGNEYVVLKNEIDTIGFEKSLFDGLRDTELYTKGKVPDIEKNQKKYSDLKKRINDLRLEYGEPKECNIDKKTHMVYSDGIVYYT